VYKLAVSFASMSAFSQFLQPAIIFALAMAPESPDEGMPMNFAVRENRFKSANPSGYGYGYSQENCRSAAV
jgi:hypothetical protein